MNVRDRIRRYRPRTKLVVALLLPLLGAGASASQESPEDVDRLVARAIALHQDGDILGAIDAYQAILEAVPERADVRSNLGAAYVRLGRLEDAIQQYRQALGEQAGDPAIRFNLGLALHKAGRFEEAAPELARVLEQRPDNDSALLLLAECYLQLEEDRKVIDLLTPVEEAHREDRAFAYLLGTALIRQDDLERGQFWIDRVLGGGESAETRLLMGAAHMRAGDATAAQEELSRAAQLDPTLPRVHYLLAQSLQALGQTEAAEQAYRRELQLNPNDYEANLYLGTLRKEAGRYDDALAYLTRATRLRPDDPIGLHALGSLHLAMGDLDGAREALEAVVERAPDFEQAHVLLAMAYFRLGRTEDADRERALARKLTEQRRSDSREEATQPDLPAQGSPGSREEPKSE